MCVHSLGAGTLEMAGITLPYKGIIKTNYFNLK